MVKGSVPRNVRREDYRMVYLIMLYSGARLEETCHLMNNVGKKEANQRLCGGPAGI